jgi:hypothetical protein
MSAAIPVTRLDRTASELRSFASKCGDGAQVRRVLAIALVLEGRSRVEAAEQNGLPSVRSVWSIGPALAAGVPGG